MINRIAAFFGGQGGSESAGGRRGFGISSKGLWSSDAPGDCRLRRAGRRRTGLRPSALEAVRRMATQGLHRGLY